MGVIDVTVPSGLPETPLVMVLAAGAGTRMGGPKVFAHVRGRAFAAHIGQTLRLIGWPAVWVLRSENQVPDLANLLDMPPDVCINNSPDGDMLSSIVVALSTPAARHARCFCIWPVDFPLIQYETLLKLAVELPSFDAVLPVNKLCTGHPLIVHRHILGRWLSTLPGAGLRQAMIENPTRVCQVPITEPGPFRNLNTPADCLAAEETGP